MLFLKEENVKKYPFDVFMEMKKETKDSILFLKDIER